MILLPLILTTFWELIGCFSLPQWMIDLVDLSHRVSWALPVLCCCSNISSTLVLRSLILTSGCFPAAFSSKGFSSEAMDRKFSFFKAYQMTNGKKFERASTSCHLVSLEEKEFRIKLSFLLWCYHVVMTIEEKIAREELALRVGHNNYYAGIAFPS